MNRRRRRTTPTQMNAVATRHVTLAANDREAIAPAFGEVRGNRPHANPRVRDRDFPCIHPLYVRETIAEWMTRRPLRGELEQAGELRRSGRELVRTLFEQMGRFARRQQCTPSDSSTCGVGAERLTLRSPREGRLVLVLQVSARAPSAVRAAIRACACEASFPQRLPRPDDLLARRTADCASGRSELDPRLAPSAKAGLLAYIASTRGTSGWSYPPAGEQQVALLRLIPFRHELVRLLPEVISRIRSKPRRQR